MTIDQQQSVNLVPQLLSALEDQALKIVDLTNQLSADTPTLRLPEPFANLIDFSAETVSEYNEPGPFWKHKNIHTGEHVGTHIDAPIHWITGKDGHDVASIPPHRLLGPAVVLDFRQQVEQDPDFLIQIEHLEAWEEKNGSLPDNGWVLFRTGWDQYSKNQEAFLNTDDTGSHTPGLSAEASEWLATQTNISGIGVDTVGIDAGRAAELDPPFPAHYYLLGNDKYGITSLQNLDQLPTTGALLIVAPLPIVDGTGSPARVLALTPGN